MKSLLLIGCILTSTSIFSQKRLNAINQTDFYSGNNFKDSSKYAYSSSEGMINSLVPKLLFNGTILKYDVGALFVHCANINKFSGFVGNTMQFTTTNTLSNGLVSQAMGSNPNIRVVYLYDLNGNMLSETNESYNSSTGWTATSSKEYAYDALGNQLSRTNFVNLSTTPHIQSADSNWFTTGTDKLTKTIRYGYNPSAGVPVPTYQSLITYTNGDIDYIDNFLYTSSTGTWEWYRRNMYYYTNNVISNINSHAVNNNVMDTTPFNEATLTYTALNQPFEILYNAPQLLPYYKHTFTYSSDGYIKSEKEYEFNSSGVATLKIEKTYYFQSTAGLEELADISISVFPNPSSDIITIQSAGTLEQVSVINFSGQVVLQQKTNVLDLTHLSKGTYLLKGRTDKGVFTEKFVKN